MAHCVVQPSWAMQPLPHFHVPGKGEGSRKAVHKVTSKLHLSCSEPISQPAASRLPMAKWGGDDLKTWGFLKFFQMGYRFYHLGAEHFKNHDKQLAKFPCASSIFSKKDIRYCMIAVAQVQCSHQMTIAEQ